MKKIVTRYEIRKVGNEVIAVWLDVNNNEVNPKDARFEGDVYVHNNSSLTSLTMPSEVGGGVYVHNNSSLTSLTMPSEVGGGVSVSNNSSLTSLTMPNEVGGDVSVHNNSSLTSLTMPSEVGGGVSVSNNSSLTSLTMPNEVGGDVSVRNNSSLTSLTMPNEVGGDVYVESNSSLKSYNIPKENKGNNYHQGSIKDLIAAIFLAKNILWADGIMSKIISQKNNVFKIRIYGKKEISYCVYRNGQFSHGKTVKEAIDSLKYKLSSRDVDQFKNWDTEKKRPVDELILAYRSITGACEFGVKDFCTQIDTEKKYSIKEVFALTNGRYGNNQFVEFFKGE